MKNETKLLKFFRVYFRIFTVIWFVILAAFVGISIAMDSMLSILPMIVVLFVGGILIYRMQMQSIVEIVINGELVEFERLDRKKGTVRLDEIIAYKEGIMGPVIVLEGGKKLYSMNGPFRMVIVNGSHVTREFHKEDFPYTNIEGRR